MPRLIVQGPADAPNLPNASSSAFGAGAARAMQETGRVTQALGQVLDEVAQSQSRASAVRYEQDLRAEADRISMDPDIMGRGAKFDAAQRKIFQRYRPKFGGLSGYDQRAEAATADVRTQFQHRTMLDGIKEARLNTQLEVQSQALKAATAETDEEAFTHLAGIRESLNSASLFYTPAEQTVALQDAIGSGLRAMADTNPKRALGLIDQLGTMLDPAVLSVYREEAQNTIKQAAREKAAEEAERRRLAEEAEKALSDRAEEELFELDANGLLTVAEVQKRVRMLDETAGPQWLDRARRGPTGEAGGTNPDIYVDLSDRASAGEDTVAEANAAYRGGLISRSERDSIVSTSRDRRFADNRKVIHDSLDPGAFTSDLGMRQKRVRALQSFDNWARSNPEASFEDAQTKANEIVKAATIRLGSLKFMGRTIKSQEDIDTALENVRRQEEQQILTATEAAARYDELRRIEIELNARAAIGSEGGE